MAGGAAVDPDLSRICPRAAQPSPIPLNHAACLRNGKEGVNGSSPLEGFAVFGLVERNRCVGRVGRSGGCVQFASKSVPDCVQDVAALGGVGGEHVAVVLLDHVDPGAHQFGEEPAVV